MGAIAVVELNMGRKKVRIHRGGRKRKAKTGQDFGTLETQEKRIRALGGKPVEVEGADGSGRPIVLRLTDGTNPDADLTLAQSPLGVLMARGLLSPDPERAKELHQAGIYFRYAFGVAYGRSSARSVLESLIAVSGGPPADDDQEVMDPVYRDMANLLTKFDRNAFNAVWRVCVDDKMIEAWYLPRLRAGLRLLARERRRIYLARKREAQARRQKPSATA
jgi:hypothetical protein